jgi:hypothetical protein
VLLRKTSGAAILLDLRGKTQATTVYEAVFVFLFVPDDDDGEDDNVDDDVEEDDVDDDVDDDVFLLSDLLLDPFEAFEWRLAAS